MNQFDNTPIMPEPINSGTPGLMGWVQTWIKAISQPNEQSYIEISESPDAKPNTAYMWIFIVGTLSMIVNGIVQTIASAFTQGDAQSAGAVIGGALVGIICAAPFFGGLSVLFFALGAAIVQWIAKLFGGIGTYDKLVYSMAAFTVPVTFVTMVLTPFIAIPILGVCVGLASMLVSFYSLFLQITAVKAVNRFGWGQAIGAVFIPGTLIFIFCACIFAIIIMVVGVSFTELFSNGFQFAP